MTLLELEFLCNYYDFLPHNFVKMYYKTHIEVMLISSLTDKKSH